MGRLQKRSEYKNLTKLLYLHKYILSLKLKTLRWHDVGPCVKKRSKQCIRMETNRLIWRHAIYASGPLIYTWEHVWIKNLNKGFGSTRTDWSDTTHHAIPSMRQVQIKRFGFGPEPDVHFCPNTLFRSSHVVPRHVSVVCFQL
jgi:hypothetical protein